MSALYNVKSKSEVKCFLTPAFKLWHSSFSFLNCGCASLSRGQCFKFDFDLPVTFFKYSAKCAVLRGILKLPKAATV